MVFDSFENAEETDDEVEAVHEKADADETDHRQLVVADVVSDGAFAASDTRDCQTRELAVPCNAREGGARDQRGEEVVERECERRRPCTDEDDLDEGICELAGCVPEAHRSAEILDVYGYHDVNQGKASEYDDNSRRRTDNTHDAVMAFNCAYANSDGKRGGGQRNVNEAEQ